MIPWPPSGIPTREPTWESYKSPPGILIFQPGTHLEWSHDPQAGFQPGATWDFNLPTWDPTWHPTWDPVPKSQMGSHLKFYMGRPGQNIQPINRPVPLSSLGKGLVANYNNPAGHTKTKHKQLSKWDIALAWLLIPAIHTGNNNRQFCCCLVLVIQWSISNLTCVSN